MKHSDIKTQEQFYEMADVHYQRTIKLREVCQNENETVERRLKAQNLFVISSLIVIKLSQIAIKFSQPMATNLKTGGVTEVIGNIHDKHVL